MYPATYCVPARSDTKYKIKKLYLQNVEIYQHSNTQCKYTTLKNKFHQMTSQNSKESPKKSRPI